jgi:hypothetical protein
MRSAFCCHRVVIRHWVARSGNRSPVARNVQRLSPPSAVSQAWQIVAYSTSYRRPGACHFLTSVRNENVLVFGGTLKGSDGILWRTALYLDHAEVVRDTAAGTIEDTDDAARSHVQQLDRPSFVVLPRPKVLSGRVIRGVNEVLASAVSLVENDLTHNLLLSVYLLVAIYGKRLSCLAR